MTPELAFNNKQQKHSILSNHNAYSYMAEKKLKKGIHRSTAWCRLKTRGRYIGKMVNSDIPLDQGQVCLLKCGTLLFMVLKADVYSGEAETLK